MISYNLAGLSQDCLAELLLKMSSESAWDVLVFQEAGAALTDQQVLVHGHFVFLTAARPGGRSHAIVVHRDWAPGVVLCEAFDRSASVDLFLGKTKWRFTSVH